MGDRPAFEISAGQCALIHTGGVLPKPGPTVRARLVVNLSSQAGREDWWPVKLTPEAQGHLEFQNPRLTVSAGSEAKFLAEPVFGKSNLNFTLASADGLLRIHRDATGVSAGETVEVFLL